MHPSLTVATGHPNLSRSTHIQRSKSSYMNEQAGQQPIFSSSSPRLKSTQTFPFFVSIKATLGPLPLISYHTSTPLLSRFGESVEFDLAESQHAVQFSSSSISLNRLGTSTATFLRSAPKVHLPFFVETASKPLKSCGRKTLLRAVSCQAHRAQGGAVEYRGVPFFVRV